MSCKHCGKRLRSKFQESRGKCPTCELIEILYRDACTLYDAGNHEGVVALIRASAGKLKIKIDEAEMHKTPTTEAAQLGLRMLADRVGAIPSCARSMGVMCAAHGGGASASEACNANEPGEAATAPPTADELIAYALDNAGWLLGDETERGNVHEVAQELADQVRDILDPSTATTDEQRVDRAHVLLKLARELLHAAGAPKSTARVRLAITSVKGALSNARHRAQRPDRKRIRRAPAMSVQTRGRS